MGTRKTNAPTSKKKTSPAQSSTGSRNRSTQSPKVGLAETARSFTPEEVTDQCLALLMTQPITIQGQILGNITSGLRKSLAGLRTQRETSYHESLQAYDFVEKSLAQAINAERDGYLIKNG